MIFCPHLRARARTCNGTLPDQTVTLMGSSAFKDEMKEDARLIGVSSFSCCPRSEVKPCLLWVLVHAAVVRPSVARADIFFSFFLVKARKPREQKKQIQLTWQKLTFTITAAIKALHNSFTAVRKVNISVPSFLMTAEPVWWARSSKTPDNGNSKYILRVVGPSESQPPAASRSRSTTAHNRKTCSNQTAP